MTQVSRFRALLRQDGMVVAPGAYDCITAKLIEQAGFAAVYMTGAGTAATLGYPDFGLVTMSEMVANAGRIAAAVELPVIADADTGYGNELNVFRTVREFNEFMIIARTDSRAVAGLDEAVSRANAALAAGANMAFVEAPQTQEEVATVPRLVRGPCLLNVVRGGKTPDLDLRDAEAMGYKLAIVPGLLIKSVVGICDQMLAELKANHRHPPPVKEMTVPEMFQRFGADEWDALRIRFRGSVRDAAE
jgi:2-methylisocitrate lyase-like PEP mutase family enzyme